MASNTYLSRSRHRAPSLFTGSVPFSLLAEPFLFAPFDSTTEILFRHRGVNKVPLRNPATLTFGTYVLHAAPTQTAKVGGVHDLRASSQPLRVSPAAPSPALNIVRRDGFYLKSRPPAGITGELNPQPKLKRQPSYCSTHLQSDLDPG